MKVHKHEDLMKHHEDNCGKCHVVIHQGYYEVTCVKCGVTEDKIVKKDSKEVRKSIIDEIDTNGNGRITKKEIKAFIKKDDDK